MKHRQQFLITVLTDDDVNPDQWEETRRVLATAFHHIALDNLGQYDDAVVQVEDAPRPSDVLSRTRPTGRTQVAPRRPEGDRTLSAVGRILRWDEHEAGLANMPDVAAVIADAAALVEQAQRMMDR